MSKLIKLYPVQFIECQFYLNKAVLKNNIEISGYNIRLAKIGKLSKVKC